MDAVGHLREMVGIPSMFPREREMGSYCMENLQRMGFEIAVHELEEGRPNIIARRGENPTLALFGHLDTVPVYGQWATDPHELTDKEGRLYGLGAADMKGGIAAFFSALERTSGPAIVILTSDEENNSAGAHLLATRPELFQGVKLMVAAEPVEHGNSEGSIMLGRRGRAVYSICVRGLSAHGAHVNRGVNAIEKASELVLALRDFPLKKGTAIGDQSLFVREISGANTSLSLPENASFQIDSHLVTGQNAESECAALETFFRNRYDNCTVEVFDRGLPYNMPYHTPPETEGVGVLKQAVEGVVGNSSWSTGQSVADENVFAQMFPVVGCGPVGRNYHSANEYVEKESLLNCARIYEKLIRSWPQH